MSDGPRILFGEGRYRVVLLGKRIVLEWRDTDAAGSTRWINVDSWNRDNTNAQTCHADIAMDCILRNYDMMVEGQVKTVRSQ